MLSREAFSITSTTTAEPKVTGVSRAASSASSVAPSIGVVASGEDTATRMRRGAPRVCSSSCTAVSVQRTRGVRGSRATKVSVCGSRSSSQGSTSAPPSKRSMIRRPEPTAPARSTLARNMTRTASTMRAVKRTSPTSRSSGGSSGAGPGRAPGSGASLRLEKGGRSGLHSAATPGQADLIVVVSPAGERNTRTAISSPCLDTATSKSR